MDEDERDTAEDLHYAGYQGGGRVEDIDASQFQGEDMREFWERLNEQARTWPDVSGWRAVESIPPAPQPPILRDYARICARNSRTIAQGTHGTGVEVSEKGESG